MEVVVKNVEDLKFIEGNTRVHSQRQIHEYIRSLKMFGQFRPMIIDENDIVLAGNGLLQALKKMGAKTADCYVMSGLSEKEKRKLMLADNKIFQLGEDDTFAFEETLSKLSGDVDIPGYGADMLKRMTSDLKSVEKAMSKSESSEPKKKNRKNLSEEKECVCPKCGYKFSRSKRNAEKSKTSVSL